MSIILKNEPVSFYANDKEASLFTNKIIGRQSFYFNSGNGSKLSGEYIDLPVNFKLPLFEQLKDDKFQYPFAESDFATPVFKGWVRNDEKWSAAIAQETTVLIKQPTRFTAAYEYSIKVTLGQTVVDDITTNIQVLGDQIQPLTNSWFEQFFEGFGIESWNSVDYFIIDQGPDIVKFYKDDILYLNTLNNKIEIYCVKIATDVNVRVSFIANQSRFNWNIYLDKSHSYTFEEIRQILASQTADIRAMGNVLYGYLNNELLDLDSSFAIEEDDSIFLIGDESVFHILLGYDLAPQDLVLDAYKTLTQSMTFAEFDAMIGTVRWIEINGQHYDRSVSEFFIGPVTDPESLIAGQIYGLFHIN